MTVLSETKHLPAGCDLPPKKHDVLRIYSMRYCPFAQRARLVLAHKGIPHEVVNVNLVSKPDWFLQRNPLGTVPTLELNDKVVFDSSISTEWLDDTYSEKKLGPSDPYAKAQWKMLAERFNKVVANFYKLPAAKTDEEKQQTAKDLRASLAVLEHALAGPYFGGDAVAMVDFHFWPWFERFGLLRSSGFELTSAEFPKLSAWIERMYQQPAVLATIQTESAHEAFMKGYRVGAPVYDP